MMRHYCYKSLLLTAALVMGSLSCSVAFQVASPPLAIKSSSASSRPLSTKLFMAQKMTPTRKTRREDSFDREDGSEDGSNEKAEDIIFDYSEAQSKMKEDENKRRVEEGLTVGLTKEVSYLCSGKNYIYIAVLECSRLLLIHVCACCDFQDEEEFNAKKDQYEDMRAKIRARASQEGFEKSVATKKAIEEATQRAMAGQASATPDQMLDLSGFGEKFTDDGTDELTPEEQAEIDKIANMNIFEQVKEELANTRFPTPIAVFQTACVMALIFAASATLILKGDATIRDIYMNQGFIPRPDEVYDFSDLSLPDGFLDQQELESNIGDAIGFAADTADSILDGGN